jgi:hypothetical protein
MLVDLLDLLAVASTLTMDAPEWRVRAWRAAR